MEIVQANTPEKYRIVKSSNNYYIQKKKLFGWKFLSNEKDLLSFTTKEKAEAEARKDSERNQPIKFGRKIEEVQANTPEGYRVVKYGNEYFPQIKIKKSWEFLFDDNDETSFEGYHTPGRAATAAHSHKSEQKYL